MLLSSPSSLKHKESTEHPLGDNVPCPQFFEDINRTLEVICRHPSHNNNNNDNKNGLVTSQDHTEDPTTAGINYYDCNR
jgi:hypothetical protein